MKTMKNVISDAENGVGELGTSLQSLEELGLLIRQHRLKLDMTLDELAAATGISKPYLSNIENARLVGPPSGEKLALLENAMGISNSALNRQADWLRTPPSIRRLMGENAASSLPRHRSGAVDLDELMRGETLAAPSTAPPPLNEENSMHESQRFPALINIPLINRVAAGTPAEFTDLDYPAGIADAYIPAPAKAAAADQGVENGIPHAGMFALRVEGDSMAQQYLPGDIIVFSTTDTPADGDDCLVRLDDQGNFATTFKRIYFVDAQGQQSPEASHVQLRPLNPRHAQRLVAREHITSLFPAIWKITPTQRGTPADQTAAPATVNEKRRKSNGLQRMRRKPAAAQATAIAAPAESVNTSESSTLLPGGHIQSATQGFAIESD
jgi:SOS-response transcriptional repressor LexA